MSIPSLLVAALTFQDPESEWRHLELLDLTVRSAVPDLYLRGGGRFALGFTRYGPNNAKANGFENPILRPLVEGRAYDTDFRVELDAVGVDSKRHSFDVWVGREL